MAHGDAAKGRAREQVDVEEDGVVRHGEVHDERANRGARQIKPPGLVVRHVGDRRVGGPRAHVHLHVLHHRQRERRDHVVEGHAQQRHRRRCALRARRLPSASALPAAARTHRLASA